MPESKSKNRSELRESELAAPVERWLARQGYRVHREVPLAAKKVDVVGLPKKGATETPWIGVELKLFKWRRALEQAAANSIVFDQNYVALWHGSVACALKDREAFEAAGVGLIGVGRNRIEVHIPASMCNRLGQPASKRAILAKLPGGARHGL